MRVMMSTEREINSNRIDPESSELSNEEREKELKLTMRNWKKEGRKKTVAEALLWRGVVGWLVASHPYLGQWSTIDKKDKNRPARCPMSGAGQKIEEAQKQKQEQEQPTSR